MALQVLRWGALVFGVFYGFSHQSAISSRDRTAHAQHEYERKESLIKQARQAWQDKTNPPKSGGMYHPHLVFGADSTGAGEWIRAGGLCKTFGRYGRGWDGSRTRTNSSTVISNPDDPNFDLEKYLQSVPTGQ